MKICYLVILLCTCVSDLCAQYCTTDSRFSDAEYFSMNQIGSNTGVVYGTALNYNGQSQNLEMNIFYPNFSEDSLEKRPLLVLVHGGCFLTGSPNEIDAMCVEFAKRGFVAVDIGYRLGWAFTPNCEDVTANTVISVNMAIYRVIQDIHASLRYLVANAATYKIDTAWIFAGGLSAGAYAIADLAFVTQEDLNILWPYINSMGNINGSGNDLQNKFTLKGLFLNWGSIIDVDYITPANAIPMIAFNGDADKISPIDSGYFEYCNHYEMMYGTRSIYNKLISYGVCSEMNVKISGGHGVYNQTYEQNVFRIGKAACFFKSMFCSECTSSYHTDSIPSDCSAKYTGLNTAKKRIDIKQLQVFPNPGAGLFSIQGNAILGSLLEVYSIEGKLLYKGKAESGKQELDLSYLKDGIYLFKSGDALARVQLIKRK